MKFSHISLDEFYLSEQEKKNIRATAQSVQHLLLMARIWSKTNSIIMAENLVLRLDLPVQQENWSNDTFVDLPAIDPDKWELEMEETVELRA